MSTPFMSEIKIMSFNFPPQGWAFCNGQFLPINQNQALFSLLGTTYGGNGQTTFALPDLRGRVPIHMGSGHTLGERAGEQAHTLSISEIPTHTHTLTATSVNGGALTAAGVDGTPPRAAKCKGQSGLSASHALCYGRLGPIRSDRVAPGG